MVLVGVDQTIGGLTGVRGLILVKLVQLLQVTSAPLYLVAVLPDRIGVVAPSYLINSVTRANASAMMPLTATCWPWLCSLSATNSPSRLGQPARTPRQMMHSYCDIINITPDTLNLAMDWECWPESDVNLAVE